MWVSIVWDQSAATIVARQLHFFIINCIHLHLVGVTVDLNDWFSWCDGSCSDFWAHMRAMRLYMASNLGQLDAMAAALVWWLNTVAISWVHNLLKALLSIKETCLIRIKMPLCALKYWLAMRSHFWRIGELLAEEYECIWLLVDCLLSEGAQIESRVETKIEPLWLLPRCQYNFFNGGSSGLDLYLLVLDDLDQFMDVIVQPCNGLLQRLESNKHFSLSSNAALIILLVENPVMPRVKLVNLLVKVGTRKATFIRMCVVCILVAWEIKVCRALRTILLMACRLSLHCIHCGQKSHNKLFHCFLSEGFRLLIIF